MKRLRSLFGGLVLAAAAGGTWAADIDVMTQNQYLGADLAPVLGAATAEPFDPQAFSAAVVEALTRIARTRPAERAQALAAMIGERRPDVVGLQEAYAFGCLPYPGVPQQPGLGCDDPDIKAAFTDHLADTLAALRGEYRVVGRVTNLKVDALPFVVKGVPALLTLADRDALLVHARHPAAAVDFSADPRCRVSDDGCVYFSAPPPFATPIGAIAIERGFVAADLSVKGVPYRVFNTHLEQRLLAPGAFATRLLQVGQAYELLGIAAGTWDGLKKLIVIGDFNSDPADGIDTPPYPPTLPGSTLPTLTPWQVFTRNGFADAWLLQPNAGPGATCCQAEGLDNRASALYERIDHVFAWPRPAQVVDMRLLGATQGDKTRPPGRAGLWPSDHAAVAARLKFD